MKNNKIQTIFVRILVILGLLILANGLGIFSISVSFDMQTLQTPSIPAVHNTINWWVVMLGAFVLAAGCAIHRRSFKGD